MKNWLVSAASMLLFTLLFAIALSAAAGAHDGSEAHFKCKGSAAYETYLVEATIQDNSTLTALSYIMKDAFYDIAYEEIRLDQLLSDASPRARHHRFMLKNDVDFGRTDLLLPKTILSGERMFTGYHIDYTGRIPLKCTLSR